MDSTLRLALSLAILLASQAFLIPARPAAAADSPSSHLVIDAEDGRVLSAENPTRVWYPASLTKIMTAYLVFEAMAQGRLDLEQKLTVSAAAAGQPASKLGLGQGRTISVEKALLATIVRSANDAAVVLAEAVSGNEAAFAAAMTEKARALGMGQTRFRNATGLPDRAQVTSARDLALLVRALQVDFPDRYPMFARHHFTLGKRRHATTNAWLKNYGGADGVKTGFTCGSGYNLAASAERSGRRLIGILLGGRSAGARNARMTQIMNAGFASGADGRATGGRIADLPLESESAPPTVLRGSECGSPAVIGNNGRLPGWGVIFGSFTSKAKASEVIKASRTSLRRVMRRGRAAIVERSRHGIRRFAALIVGLKQPDAGAACRHLWSEGRYCLALSPEQLNNPQAIWR